MVIGWRWLWVVAPGVLLAVLVAMRFTDAVRWTALDFVAAGALLVGGGLALELVARRARGGWRWVLGGVVVGAVLLLWAQGAVGVF